MEHIQGDRDLKLLSTQRGTWMTTASVLRPTLAALILLLGIILLYFYSVFVPHVLAYTWSNPDISPAINDSPHFSCTEKSIVIRRFFFFKNKWRRPAIHFLFRAHSNLSPIHHFLQHVSSSTLSTIFNCSISIFTYHNLSKIWKSSQIAANHQITTWLKLPVSCFARITFTLHILFFHRAQGNISYLSSIFPSKYELSHGHHI